MDWLPYIPDDDAVQVSRNTDFQACGSYSFIHILQILLKYKTGLFFDFSERALAKLSDTQAWGNSLQNIVDAVNEDGLLLAEDWPELTHAGKYEDIDWATYYADIPEAVLKRAYACKAGFSKLQATQVASALKKAPLWTIIKTSSGKFHIVAQINETQYYDSYEIKIKDFQSGQIQSQYQLTINLTNMPNGEFIKKSGTSEFGFYLPALSIDALKDKAMNFGIPITDNNGNVDFSKAKEVKF